jgi:hypothetical protein
MDLSDAFSEVAHEVTLVTVVSIGVIRSPLKSK